MPPPPARQRYAAAVAMAGPAYSEEEAVSSGQESDYSASQDSRPQRSHKRKDGGRAGERRSHKKKGGADGGKRHACTHTPLVPAVPMLPACAVQSALLLLQGVDCAG